MPCPAHSSSELPPSTGPRWPPAQPLGGVLAHRDRIGSWLAKRRRPWFLITQDACRATRRCGRAVGWRDRGCSRLLIRSRPPPRHRTVSRDQHWLACAQAPGCSTVPQAYLRRPWRIGDRLRGKEHSRITTRLEPGTQDVRCATRSSHRHHCISDGLLVWVQGIRAVSPCVPCFRGPAGIPASSLQAAARSTMLIAQQAKCIMTAVRTQGRRKMILPEIPIRMARTLDAEKNSAGWIHV